MRKKLLLIVILSLIMFLAGCMGGTSTTSSLPDGDLSTKLSDDNSVYVDITGKVTFVDNSVIPLGTEVYFYRTGDLPSSSSSDGDSDTNLNRVSAPDANYDYKALTDADGNFSLKQVKAGIYKIIAYKANYSYSELDNFEISENSKSVNITIAKPGKLVGRVLYPDGSVKYGVRIYIGQNYYLTDVNGRFEITLPAGEHVVVIDEFGYVKVTKTVNIESDKIYDLGDIVLQKDYINPDMAVLQSKVITSFGVPVSDAIINLEGSSQTYTALTDQDGEFQINNILPGDYVLKVIKDYYGVNSMLTFEKGQLMKIDNIVLDNLYKYGVIDVSLNLEAQKDDSFEIKIISSVDASVIYDKVFKDVDFKIYGISAGQYIFNVISEHFNAVSQNINVVNGNTLSLDIPLNLKKAVFSGHVYDENNNPIKANLTFGNITAVSGDDGSFTFGDLDEGTYSFYVKAFGYNEFVTSITIESGNNITNYNVNLSAKTDDGIDQTVSLNFTPLKASQNGNYLYVLASDKKNIYKIDKQTNSVSSLISTNDLIEDFLIDKTRGKIYCIDSYNNVLTEYDLDGNVMRSINVGNEPFRIIDDNDTLYILSRGDQTLYTVGKDDFSKNSYSLGFIPFDEAYASGVVFIADKYNNSVSLFDTVNKNFTSTITSLTRPIKLYTDEDNGRLFVLKENSTEINVINVNTLVEEKVIDTGVIPSFLGFGKNYVYMIGNSSKITIFDRNYLSLTKLNDVAYDMISVVEDSLNENRLYVFENAEQYIVYFCK